MDRGPFPLREGVFTQVSRILNLNMVTADK